jgi:hypothetical protein
VLDDKATLVRAAAVYIHARRRSSHVWGQMRSRNFRLALNWLMMSVHIKFGDRNKPAISIGPPSLAAILGS